MKKTLIPSLIAVLLIAGYFVGQAAFSTSSTGTKSSAGNMGVSSSGGDPGFSQQYEARKTALEPSSNKGVSVDDIANSQVYECGALDDCSAPVDPTLPYVGNPKGTKIVKSGTVTVSIPKKSLSKNFNKVVALAKDGGYIEESSSRVDQSTLTLRIPTEKLDSVLAQLRKIGTVTSEKVGSVDHSYEAIDMDARLSILNQRKDVLVESLKKAQPSETANIQEQIFSVQTDIETLTGQQKLLNDQVALSTLKVTLSEKGSKAINAGSETMIHKAWTKASNSLLTSFGGILIVLAALAPFIILGLLLFPLLRPLVRSYKARRVSKTVEKE